VKKILFPTEFSGHADHMFRYALELADKLDAELISMHAYGRPEGFSIGDDEAKKERVLEKLHQFAEEHTPEEYADIKISFTAELDYPSDAIINVAEKKDVDLIVLGMTGKTNDVNRHLGSNALKVIRAADCPVLAIPASADYQHIDKIVTTTDFDFEDLIVLNFLNHTFPDAEVCVVHVLDKPRERQQAEKKIKALVTAYGQHQKVKFGLLEGKDVEKQIEQYVESEKANLLVMTSHRRSVIQLLLEGSTARNIAKHTKTPLLVFRND